MHTRPNLDISCFCSYDISSAETMIRNSCGLVKNQVIQNVFAGDVDGAEWSKVLSPPRKKVHTNPHNSPASPNNNINARILSPRIDNTLYQTMSEHNQSYQDFRAEAEVHKNLRTEYFQKAAVAFQQKQGQVSQYYADKVIFFFWWIKVYHRKYFDLRSFFLLWKLSLYVSMVTKKPFIKTIRWLLFLTRRSSTCLQLQYQ